MSGPLGFGEEPEEPRDVPQRPDDREERPRFPGAGANATRYGWIAGGIALLLLLYIGLNTLRTSGDGVGSTGPEVGEQARAFAAPLATSALKGDVNIATEDDQGEAGKVAACSVRLPGAFNVCDLWDRGPAAIVFFVDRSGQCIDELDTFQRVIAKHPGVGVVAVGIRGKRSHLAGLVRRRGWDFPVVYDHDGVLANLYGVAVCPQVTYVRKGGVVAGTNIGELSASELDAQLTALQRGARDVVT